MEKIISIQEYKNNQFEKAAIDLTVEDVFNLFLIFARAEEILPIVDLNILMESLAKYKNINRYHSIYKNLKIEKNDDGKDIINLEKCLETKINSKTILINPSKSNEIVILDNDEEFEQLIEKYDEHTISVFRDLMFNIHMDLEYGINNWSLIAEDEYIEDPIYPSIVTSEFIGQEKDKKVMKKVRKRAIESLKNLYE